MQWVSPGKAIPFFGRFEGDSLLEMLLQIPNHPFYERFDDTDDTFLCPLCAPCAKL